MKYTLTLLALLIYLCASAQQEQRNFGIAEVFRGGDSIFIKKLKTLVIKVSDGLVTKQDTNIDSARLFISSDGALYQGTTVWRKVNVTIPNPVTEKIDGESATFVGSWTRTANNATWHNGTIAYSNSPGATATYEFSGTKIELWAERLTTHGTGTVKINTGAEVPVTFNTSPLGLPVKVYESQTLPSGTHKIVLKVTAGYCLLDYFLVTR